MRAARTVGVFLALAVCAYAQSQEPLDIAFLTAELKPYTSTGGLGNVSQELPEGLRQLGHRPVIITPLYHTISTAKHGLQDTGQTFQVDGETVRLWRGGVGGVDVYFLDHPMFTSMRDGGIYVDAQGRDYADAPGRYDFMSRASLAAVKALGIRPQVIHANDHHLGAVPWYAKQDRYFDGAVKVFQVHNAMYQGQFEASRLGETRLGPAFGTPTVPGPAEFFGRVNPMKLGIVSADVVLAVSPNYAREIQDWRFGAGLEGVLAERAKEGRLIGILNGLDEEVWDPSRDPSIVQRYSASTLDQKGINKSTLQSEYFGGSSPKVPVVATVSRVTEQKGIDEIVFAVEELARAGRSFQYLLVGTPDGQLSTKLEALAARYPGQVVYDPNFTSVKEHRTYAGADLYLMPSRWEPGGLPQLYAMRYGTVPVVSRVGGLVDSVTEFNLATGRGTGVMFGAEFPATTWGMGKAAYERVLEEYAQARLEATRDGLARALDLYEQSGVYRLMQLNGMAGENRWTKRAGPEYVRTYRRFLGGVRDVAPGLVRREIAGAGTFVAAYLLKESMKAVETRDLAVMKGAAAQLGTLRFWGDLGLFTVAARGAEVLLNRARAGSLFRTALPLTVGMTAIQLGHGHFSARDLAIDTVSFLASGAAVAFLADGLLVPALFSSPPRWLFSVAKLAVTLYAGEKGGDFLRRFFSRDAAKEGAVQKVRRLCEIPD